MKNGTETSRLLLIDDDRELGQMLRDFLAPDKLQLLLCTNGEDGLAQHDQQGFDLIILDIMLPGMSGLDVLRKLREKSGVPVIMLTARGDDVDRIIGLEFGADDYLAKPFNPRELLARIKAILRRTHFSPEIDGKQVFGSIALDSRTRSVSVSGKPLPLTGTEFELLGCLMQTPGEVVSKERLSEQALGRRLLPYDRSIDTHISNLRGKLEESGNSNESIQNQRGVGYVLIPNTRRDRGRS